MFRLSGCGMMIVDRVLGPIFAVLLLSSPALAIAGESLDALLTRHDFDGVVDNVFRSPAPDNTATAIRRLVSRARELDLAKRPMWRALLHYRKNFSGDWESEVDANHFFMSSQGKTHPDKELEATLASFFSTTVKSPMRLTPYCRFVARRQWLAEALGADARWLPTAPCPEFEQYKRFFKTDMLTVVFPSAHPNSPSSAFGHTLLRLDKQGQSPELRMLNQSLNFAAEVPEDVNPIAYVIGGVAGGFKGKFRFLPYHIKLREYAQVDNRDIWEYELNLDDRQIDRILAHAYEMLIAWFDYYFFRENCAYHLLSILDVADPDLRLTAPFRLWAIPIDTIKVLEQKGLIRKRRFIGSLARKIRSEQQPLQPSLLALADAQSNAKKPDMNPTLATLPRQMQARLLDLAADYARYRRLNSGGRINRLSPIERRLLGLRSKIRVATPDPHVARPATAPDQGHGTSRVELGIENKDGNILHTLQYRPAYHDFLDPSAGYGENTAIDFISPTLAWDADGRAFLKAFTLLDIQSVEPRDHFFKPVSWRTRIAWRKSGKNQPARFEILGGAGLAKRFGQRAMTGFIFTEGSLARDAANEHLGTVEGGLRAGILWKPVARLRTIIEMAVARDFRNNIDKYRSHLGLGWTLQKNLALVADVEENGHRADKLKPDIRVAIRWYH